MSSRPTEEASPGSGNMEAPAEPSGAMQGAPKSPAGRFPEALAARVLSSFPTPIADAVVALLAAESPFEQRDRVVEIFRAELRLLAAYVLAIRVQFGPGPDGESTAAPELLRSLRARGLTDGQWVALVRELLRPWEKTPDAYPIAALVKLVHGRKSELVKLWDELLVMRKSETVAHGASGTRDALLAILARRTPQLVRTLELLDPVLAAYRVVELRGGAEPERTASLFVGPTAPSGRARSVEVASDVALAPGDVGLLDGQGRAKVLLSPIVLSRRPTRDASEELFLLDGSARRGALYVAFPSMAEHKEASAWESLAEVMTADEAAASESDEQGRPTRPYRGLAAFGPEEASLFFGREEQAETLSNRIRRHGWVTVTGPSGSGKTSLLRAGVLPTLRDTMVAFLRPGAHPLASLSSRLSEATEIDRNEMDALVRAPAKLSLAIDGLARSRSTSLVLVIDQGEELLTLASDAAEREDFGRALVALAERQGSARVVFSVREDFFARLANVRSLFGVFSAQVEVVTTPDRDALIRMLLGPARAFGYAFEDADTVTALCDSIADARAALALLSFTADRLWEARDRKWKRLTVAAYDAMGGAMGALASHADSVLGGMAPSEITTTRSIFMRLVTGEHTRAVVARAEILEAARDEAETSRVLDRLIAGRLLTASEDADGVATLEIMHEALIQHWSMLSRWLSEDVEGQRLTHALRQSAREWATRGRPRGLLWHGELLDELHLYLRRGREPLTGNERAFADACDKDARTQKRVRSALVAGAFLALAAFAAFMFWQWQKTEAARVETERERQETAREKTRAEVRGLVAEARGKESRGLADDAHALMRAAVELEADLGVTEETAQSLDLLRLDAAGAGAMVFTGPTRPIMHVRTAVKHRRIIASGSDDDVFVLDGDTGETVGRLPHPGFIVWDMEVSRDEEYLATASSDNRGEKGLLRVYALPSLELLHELRIGAGLRELAFANGDGTLLVRASTGPATLLSLSDGEPRTLGETSGAVVAIAASDGEALALTTAKETRILGPDGHVRFSIAAEDRDVTALALSADGKTLARGRSDGWVDIFDTASGAPRGRAQTQPARIGGLALIDGHLIAATEEHKLEVINIATKQRRTLDTVGGGAPRFVAADGIIGLIEDKSVTALDLASGARLATRTGHDGDVTDVALYGHRLVTAGWDRTIRVWPDRPYPIERIVPAELTLSHVAYSEDRSRVAVAPQGRQAIADLTVSATGTAGKPILRRRPPGFTRGVALDTRGEQLAFVTEADGAEVVEVESGRTLRSLVAPGGAKLTAMAARPDFSGIAIGDNTGVLALVPERGASQLYAIASDMVVNMAISPDGKLIASTTGERVARLNRWDDGAEVFALTMKGVAAALAFSSDGKLFAVGDQNSVRVFALDTLELVFQRDTDDNAVIGLEFSPDSTRLAAATSSSGDDGLFIVDLGAGTVRVLEVKDAAMDLSFSPDGHRLLAAQGSGMLTIWQDGKEPASVYRPFSRGVISARFLGDGDEVLAVAFGSGMVTVHTPEANRGALLESSGRMTTLRVCRSTLAVVPVAPGGPTGAFTNDPLCEGERAAAPRATE